MIQTNKVTAMSSGLCVDLHADTPVLLRYGMNLGVRHRPPLPAAAWGFHIDIPRMREGGLSAQFFGLTSFPGKLPFLGGGPASTINRLLDALEKAERQNSDEFVLVKRAQEVRAAHGAGKIAGLTGIEGAHALEGDIESVGHFARRGVSYLGLLHFSRNEAGAPAFGYGRDDSMGLTDFGKNLVQELNRMKMIVDLAHINKKGFMDAARLSKAPVLVSHTGIHGAYPHWRNIDDEQIRAVAEKGGCTGVIFSRYYLGRNHIDAVCEHIEHVVKVGGEDTPALGSDFDGLITPVKGLGDVSRIPRLAERLKDRGLSPRQLDKVMGENALRVLESVAG